jgi:hypothetical protein
MAETSQLAGRLMKTSLFLPHLTPRAYLIGSLLLFAWFGSSKAHKEQARNPTGSAAGTRTSMKRRAPQFPTAKPAAGV